VSSQQLSDLVVLYLCEVHVPFADSGEILRFAERHDPVDVLGHSFGGICALEAALLTPNIRKLVLYEPAPPGFKEAPGTIDQMQAALDSGDRKGVLSTFFLEAAGLTPSELKLMRSVPAWQGRVAAAHTILREIKSIETLPPFEADRFGRLETQALLLLGGDSIAEYKETIEQIHHILPNSRITVMPGQQHVAMNTAPELFVQEVLDFLMQP
jgi:pimeloyl-ACP methyl ester carboxylesterase